MSRRASEDCLYEDDAVDIGVMLFGVRTCVSCGRELPANADYFPRTMLSDGPGLKTVCRQCHRTYNRERQAAKAVAP
jgi:hypothetical protein